MPKLRTISGEELIKILTKQGFHILRQKGSHVRLEFVKREVKYLITIPLHKQLDRGTLKSIIRALQDYIPADTINALFY